MPKDTRKFLDSQGLAVLWALIKQNFVKKEAGKGLSTNDFTDEIETKLVNMSPGDYGNQNAYSYMKYGATTVAATSETDTFEFINGSNVTLAADASNKTLTISATDTTYSEATTSASGLLSSTDKAKLDGVATGAEVNAISSISVNGNSQTITNKNVNISVPTNNNQLTNGAGYQTASDVNSLISAAVSSAYIFKGSVTNASDLPSSNLTVGDVYNIVNESTYGGPGMNVAWTGTAWDPLGSDFTIDAMTSSDVTSICTFDD